MRAPKFPKMKSLSFTKLAEALPEPSHIPELILLQMMYEHPLCGACNALIIGEYRSRIVSGMAPAFQGLYLGNAHLVPHDDRCNGFPETTYLFLNNEPFVPWQSLHNGSFLITTIDTSHWILGTRGRNKPAWQQVYQQLMRDESMKEPLSPKRKTLQYLAFKLSEYYDS